MIHGCGSSWLRLRRLVLLLSRHTRRPTALCLSDFRSRSSAPFFAASPPESSGRTRLLTTSGPYAWTRNPLYFGSFLAGTGLRSHERELDCGSRDYPAVIGCVYPHVIRNEEAHLHGCFPKQFREYCARVPRFFPRFRPVLDLSPSSNTSPTANTTRRWVFS